MLVLPPPLPSSPAKRQGEGTSRRGPRWRNKRAKCMGEETRRRSDSVREYEGERPQLSEVTARVVLGTGRLFSSTRTIRALCLRMSSSPNIP